MIKKTNKKKYMEEPIIECDKSKEVVAKCDRLQITKLY